MGRLLRPPGPLFARRAVCGRCALICIGRQSARTERIAEPSRVVRAGVRIRRTGAARRSTDPSSTFDGTIGGRAVGCCVSDGCLQKGRTVESNTKGRAQPAIVARPATADARANVSIGAFSADVVLPVGAGVDRRRALRRRRAGKAGRQRVKAAADFGACAIHCTGSHGTGWLTLGWRAGRCAVHLRYDIRRSSTIERGAAIGRSATTGRAGSRRHRPAARPDGANQTNRNRPPSPAVIHRTPPIPLDVPY